MRIALSLLSLLAITSLAQAQTQDFYLLESEVQFELGKVEPDSYKSRHEVRKMMAVLRRDVSREVSAAQGRVLLRGSALVGHLPGLEVARGRVRMLLQLPRGSWSGPLQTRDLVPLGPDYTVKLHLYVFGRSEPVMPSITLSLRELDIILRDPGAARHRVLGALLQHRWREGTKGYPQDTEPRGLVKVTRTARLLMPPSVLKEVLGLSLQYRLLRASDREPDLVPISSDEARGFTKALGVARLENTSPELRSKMLRLRVRRVRELSPKDFDLLQSLIDEGHREGLTNKLNP